MIEHLVDKVLYIRLIVLHLVYVALFFASRQTIGIPLGIYLALFIIFVVYAGSKRSQLDANVYWNLANKALKQFTVPIAVGAAIYFVSEVLQNFKKLNFVNHVILVVFANKPRCHAAMPLRIIISCCSKVHKIYVQIQGNRIKNGDEGQWGDQR